MIEAKPAVKIQSASASPGIAIAPPSVVQVPMPDDGSTGSGAVDTEAVSMVSGDEEVNEGEDNESGDGDDEEEVEVSRLLTTMSGGLEALDDDEDDA